MTTTAGRLACLGAVLLSLSIPAAGAAKGPDEGTMAGDGELGHAQSPIDLPWPLSDEGEHHEIMLRYDETAEHLIHKAHTIEVEYDEGSVLEFDGRPYSLEQFHFHTPSEHLLAGRRFPIELHLVHHDAEGRALVVGILFDRGAASPFLERILSDAPATIGRVDRKRPLNVANLFPAETHFYTYAGSFTTPPFTEGVQWLILDSHPQASADQIVRLLVLEGGNARDAQPRYGRPVAQD